MKPLIRYAALAGVGLLMATAVAGSSPVQEVAYHLERGAREEWQEYSGVRFGVVADAHIGPTGYWGGRPQKLTHYSEQFLDEFVDIMNSEVQPDFVVQLGDFIEDADHETDLENFASGIDALDELDCPMYHVIGNHDTVNLSHDELEELTGLSQHYYSFDYEDYRFIVLAPQPTWDSGSYAVEIPDEQMSWLEEELESSEKEVIIFSHQSLADQDLSGNIWFERWPEGALVRNRDEVKDLFEESGNVIAVFNGHLHWNHMDVEDSIPYLTIQSLVENVNGKPSAAYAVVELDEDSITVSVFGNDPSTMSHSR